LRTVEQVVRAVVVEVEDDLYAMSPRACSNTAQAREFLGVEVAEKRGLDPLPTEGDANELHTT
jgi:hypothetical protein